MVSSLCHLDLVGVRGIHLGFWLMHSYAFSQSCSVPPFLFIVMMGEFISCACTCLNFCPCSSYVKTSAHNCSIGQCINSLLPCSILSWIKKYLTCMCSLLVELKAVIFSILHATQIMLEYNVLFHVVSLHLSKIASLQHF